ncbi:hypothetical protein AB6A40_000675 [Gnathostoma spinigerum]|uniref:Nucleotide-diphospho-sugar transferase domain-containing protein n=1 Tax=Gnathostoma spinigerum TaxID=75299 RepID=A0ABD6E4M3_9BILA
MVSLATLIWDITSDNEVDSSPVDTDLNIVSPTMLDVTAVAYNSVVFEVRPVFSAIILSQYSFVNCRTMRTTQFVNHRLSSLLPFSVRGFFRRRLLLTVTLILLVVVAVEEIYFAKIRFAYQSFSWKTIEGNITRSRIDYMRHIANRPLMNITILTVLANDKNHDEYALAQSSFECYAIYHHYAWKVIDLSESPTLQQLCPQKDFMFARHCVTAEVLKNDTSIEWILFIDADMGVINPNRLIEEWIDESVDLIFYNRIFNHEIMAGSYLAKNSLFAREFLQYWADYDYRVPHSFHGTDNGAIQNVFLEKIMPERREEWAPCEVLWGNSKDFKGLYAYEKCARKILGSTGRWTGQASILPKGTAWARDTWLTNSHWSPNDFVLHAWKNSTLNAVTFAGWLTPLASHYFNLSICETNSAGKNWKYKYSFMASELDIDKMINSWIEEVEVFFHLPATVLVLTFIAYLLLALLSFSRYGLT